ncbi:ATP-binding subunit of heat shock protein ClpB, partial [Rhodococcus wratislaviensis IFP 2016]
MEASPANSRRTRRSSRRAACLSCSDAASKARLEELRKELADLRAEADARHAQWEAERQAIRRVQELRGEL